MHSIGSRITQKVYLLLLLGLVVSLVYIAVMRMFYMEERGLIEIERTQISSASGGRIISMPVAQGQVVKKYDLLARVQNGDGDCVERPNNQHIKLKLELQANKDKRVLLMERLAERRKLVSQKTLRRALEIDYGRAAQERKIAREVEDLELEIKLLAREIQQQLAMLNSLEANAHNGNGCNIEEIHAPKAGVIHAVNLGAYEVARRGESILSFVPDNAAVRVETYVDDDEINVVTQGKPAVVVLPDKQSLDAIIESVRSSASLRAEREWDQYVPVKTKLLVRLVPASRHDTALWKKYDRVNVKVRILR